MTYFTYGTLHPFQKPTLSPMKYAAPFVVILANLFHNSIIHKLLIAFHANLHLHLS
jgi:hypothetical protein